MIRVSLALVYFSEITVALTTEVYLKKVLPEPLNVETTESTQIYEAAAIQSVLQCASVCAMTGGCVSLTYSQTGAVCRMYNATLNATPNPQAPVDTTYFNVIKRVPALDCVDVADSMSGVYEVRPRGMGNTISVWCDMETDGGGWTVFQRRQNGSVDFNRDWAGYETGFGDLTGEFWLGNSYIHTITSGGSYELRIDLADSNGEMRYAQYSSFIVNGAASSYRVAVSGYSGDAGDSFGIHSGMAFTTPDRDHDIWDSDTFSGNCAIKRVAGWWFADCGQCSLNGVYHVGTQTGFGHGLHWQHWKGELYSLEKCTMMIRRRP
ncbi:hypothetical protein ScPMuIL_001155 [Solemya velum]